MDLKQQHHGVMSLLKRISKTFFCLLVLSVAITGPVTSASPYIVAVYPENPPFLYDDNGHPAGMYLDIVRETFIAMEQPIEVRLLPFRRALQMAYDGDAIVAGILETPERARLLDFSKAIYKEEMVVFTAKDHPRYYRSVEDLTGRTFGVILGWSYGVRVDEARGTNQFQTVEGTLMANILATSQGMVDGFIHSRLSGLYQLQMSGMTDRIKVNSDPISQVDIFIAGKKGEFSELMRRFNQQLVILKENGALDDIVYEYSSLYMTSPEASGE
ncbi:substrate-binding periplasmic protein [Hahella ganghwensis]|uniref:substrate-binding periplasmic protein n=1 Tax=Hahella ganghwensis TaxID=286420 RepID=UPI00036E72F5|nr:transporter substrate-binding domain-containing protein [Hahella ganghwensis]